MSEQDDGQVGKRFRLEFSYITRAGEERIVPITLANSLMLLVSVVAIPLWALGTAAYFNGDYIDKLATVYQRVEQARLNGDDVRDSFERHGGSRSCDPAIVDAAFQRGVASALTLDQGVPVVIGSQPAAAVNAAVAAASTDAVVPATPAPTGLVVPGPKSEAAQVSGSDGLTVSAKPSEDGRFAVGQVMVGNLASAQIPVSFEVRNNDRGSRADSFLWAVADFMDAKGKVTSVPFQATLRLDKEGHPADHWSGYRIDIRYRKVLSLNFPSKDVVGMTMKSVRIGISDVQHTEPQEFVRTDLKPMRGLSASQRKTPTDHSL